MGGVAILADEAILHYRQEMHVLRHDDVVLYLNDWIMLGNAMQQFVFHHSS